MTARAEVLPLVLADLSARIAKGRAEYGEPLTVLVTGQPSAGPVDQRVSALVEKRDDA